MKCINEKCDKGLWTKDGCLFPSENDETCVDFIPEQKQDERVFLAGSVSATLMLIEKASNHIDDLCQGKKRWTMSVPVDELNDSDFVLQNALTEAKMIIEKQNRVTDKK